MSKLFIMFIVVTMTTSHQQPTHVIITALKLILVTIECGGHHLECSHQLTELIGDQLCYHLFMVWPLPCRPHKHHLQCSCYPTQDLFLCSAW